MKHVTQYFETYPESKEVFETSDGFLFHKEVDAKNHATTLKDKDITPHKRKNVVEADKAPAANKVEKKVSGKIKAAKEADKTPGIDESKEAGDGGAGEGDQGGESGEGDGGDGGDDDGKGAE